MSAEGKEPSAIEVVGLYYERQLAVLLGHVTDAVERFNRDDLSAVEADAVMFQYARAARKLWSYCHVGNTGETARAIADSVAPDWWDLGAYRRR